MTLLAMIEAAAAKHAAHVAIEEADGTVVRYAELLARARRFAAEMRDRVVEVAAERSADFVARCLGAWLAGRAWAPVDPAEPPARRAAFRESLADAAHPELAYVIATSGSTGVPKAVMVPHAGLPALVRAQVAAFELHPGARSLWLHAPVFDASLSDWATALISGATLVAASPAPVASQLAARAITHVDLPTALLGHVAHPPAGLRVVVLGGEACPVDAVRALARRVRVVVVYGPTEATVCTSLVRVDATRWARPLIGEPIDGIRYRVVEGSAAGSGGELWIAGEGLAIGYAGDRAATERAFVSIDGERWYRTGDRVAPTPDGLAFVGRSDRQHKIAGHRVELDEVEAALRRIPGVRDAAAVVRAVAGRDRIAAFIDGEASAAELRRRLDEHVPAWMCPARFVVGPLPRLASGKVDRAALTLDDAATVIDDHGTDRSRDDDPVAAELAPLWRAALGTSMLTASFREAGGDSIAALSLHAAALARAIPLDLDAVAGDASFASVVARVRAAPPPIGRSVAECEARGLEQLQARTAPRPGRAGTAVLFTGATGLLGPRLISAWRARDNRRLVVLVRAADDASARSRLVAGFASDGVATEGIDVVRGDVTLPELGIDDARWQDIGTIVHAAATMRLADGWDAHAPVNVGGTVEVARVARARELAWHHVSTLSVFAGTDRGEGRHAPADVPVPDARAFGGYAQTKLAAEAIARATRGRAAPTTIFRLGLLAGTEQLRRTLAGLVALGAAPIVDAQLRVDQTPVDQAAAVIAGRALAARRDAVFHIAGRGVSFDELVAPLGLPRIAAEEWARRARAALADLDVAMAYLSLGRAIGLGERARPFDLFLATGADYAAEQL